MTALLAWLWTPVLFYAVAAGLGLLATRLLRVTLPAALVAPVGLALATIVLILGYRAVPGLAVPVLLVLAVAGLALEFRNLRERLWSPAGLGAAALVYALYIGPVVLSGTASWAGYNFVNDTAVNFLLADSLAHHGFVAPTDVSGTGVTLRAFLGFGYPLGAFALVGGLQPLTGAPLESIYQPAIALFAGFGAMSLTEIARRAGLGPKRVVLVAALPFAGVLTYRYALHGAIKEILLVCFLMTGAAVAAVTAERRLDLRLVVLLGLVMVAAILAFSFAAAGYAVVLGVVMLGWAYTSGNRPSRKQVVRLLGGVAVIGVIVLLPTLGSAIEFAKSAKASFASSGGDATAQFGQLVRQLPVTEGAGVWLNDDYRYAASSSFNPVVIGAVIAAFLAGIAVCVARRRFVPLGLLAVLIVPAAVLAPTSSPYIDGKLMAVFTPGVVFVAVLAGAAGLTQQRRAVRALAVVGVAVVVAGVGWSAAYSYRNTQFGPIARVDAMKDAAAHAPDDRLYLLNEWEEYGKYFMRAVRVNPASEATSPAPVRLRRDMPIFAQWFDLDLQQLDYVTQWRGIILRRSPGASRPPANFRRAYVNDYYEVWLRRAGPRVLRHLPLQSSSRATGIPRCQDVRRLARGARPGDRVVAAQRPRLSNLSPLLARKPRYWPKSGEAPDAITPVGGGSFSGTLFAEGAQRVWVRTTTGRRLSVFVDGRRVGSVQQINSPGQWLMAGTVRLRRGMHRVELRRPKSSLGPGQAVKGSIGPVGLEAVGRPRLVSIPPADADRLCGRLWDWIELVRPRR